MEINVPAEDLNDTTPPATVIRKSRKLPTECKICRALALYSYFGVVVCASCKIFFRRNAQKKQGQFKCRYDGHCEININTRHICTSCRLAKCFASGMQAELIRAPRTAKKNTSHNTPVMIISTIPSTRKEKEQPQQLPIFNLLRPDHSRLTIEQWNLLSNLTHCYDEYSEFSVAQQFMEEQHELPPKMRFKLAPVRELVRLITSAGQLLYEKNVDFLTLCSHDRSILIHNTLRYVAGLGACFILRHTGLLEDPAFYKSVEVIYGSDSTSDGSRAIVQLDFDSTFVKLILALLTFSTYSYTHYTNVAPVNLNNVSAVLHIQDSYTELVWRYLLYKYDHERAVLCFSNLMRCLILVNDAIVRADECKQYIDMIDSLVKQTEETLTLTECLFSVVEQ